MAVLLVLFAMLLAGAVGYGIGVPLSRLPGPYSSLLGLAMVPFYAALMVAFDDFRQFVARNAPRAQYIILAAFCCGVLLSGFHVLPLRAGA